MGNGATVTSGTITTSSGDYVVPVGDGAAFPDGAWCYINDGTNSVLAPVKSGGGTTTLTLDHTQASTTGTVTSIANGTTVTFGGKPNGAASYAALAYLTSPVGCGGASMGNVLSTGSIVVGASGNVILMVSGWLYNSPGVGDGAHTQFVRDGSTTITTPDVLQSFSSATSQWFGFTYVDTGLTPGASHTYEFQAAAAGSTGGQNISELSIIVYTP